jgi:hypothetical protein
MIPTVIAVFIRVGMKTIGVCGEDLDDARMIELRDGVSGCLSSAVADSRRCRQYITILFPNDHRHPDPNHPEQLHGVPVGKAKAAMRAGLTNLLRARRAVNAITW